MSMTAATYADTANPILDALKAGPAWTRLTPHEQTAAIAIASRLASMVTEGATPEDWSQIAGYVEWAQRPRPKLTLEGAVVHGVWYDWPGGAQPVNDDARIEARLRAGVTCRGKAGGLRWAHEDRNGDIVAYRIVD